MSSAADKDKEAPSGVPLDLARNQMVPVRPVESAKPLVMTTHALRSVRVLTSSNASNSAQGVGPTIITNIVPGAVLKQDNPQISGIITTTTQLSQTQMSGGLTIQRPAQLTLTTPLMTQNPAGGTSYHVPRGPAVVANLASPRSNIASVRSPIVVTSQHTSGHAAFVRPARTPSPAQNTTAWLATSVSSSNQIKGAPTIITPIRGATIPGGAKLQLAARPQSSQTIPTIRAGAIIQSNITIAAPTHIQALRPATLNEVQQQPTLATGGVTIAQMLPTRTQAVIYGTSTIASPMATQGARLTVATALPSQVRPTVQTRPPVQTQIIGSRLPIVSQIQGFKDQGPRLLSPVRPASITPVVRPSSVASPMHTQILGTTNKVITTTQPTPLAKITAIPNPSTTISVSTSNTTTVVSNASGFLGSQQRIPNLSTLNLQSLVAVATSHNRMQTVHGPKVITQPAQGPATIHLTSLAPQISQTTTSHVNASVISSGTRTINVPATIVAHASQQQRPPGALGGVSVPETIPIAKVYTSTDAQGGTTTLGGANIFAVHAPLPGQRPVSGNSAGPTTATIVPHHTAVSSIQVSKTQAYPLQSNNSYFFETTVNSGNSYINRPLPGQPGQGQQPVSLAQQHVTLGQQQGAFASISQTSVSVTNQPNSRPTLMPVQNSQHLHGVLTAQQLRYTPAVVVEQRGQQAPQTVFTGSSTVQNLSTTEGQNLSDAFSQNKVPSSPRPSILRKRDHEGSPLKAAKNLSAVLQGVIPESQSPSPPPDSRDNGHSSGGSTTISATSSPGLQEMNEDSNLMAPVDLKSSKDEEENKPPVEMSPRKKPRKQQLTTGNDIAEHHDDMQFISENGAIKKENYDSDDRRSEGEPKDGAPEAVQVPTIRKPATASLLNGYKQNWKATHNHFQRYSDVKPKDERRPTIMDLSNQNKVHDKVNGWKIHHLTTQMEDLAEQEQSVYNKLTELLKFTEAEEMNKQFEKDFNRVNELIKGNLQRIKIIEDGMLDAKSQIMKVFDHQKHVSDIISRCASKRNFKKREKS